MSIQQVGERINHFEMRMRCRVAKLIYFSNSNSSQPSYRMNSLWWLIKTNVCLAEHIDYTILHRRSWSLLIVARQKIWSFYYKQVYQATRLNKILKKVYKMKTNASYYLILFVYSFLWVCQVVSGHLTHS